MTPGCSATKDNDTGRGFITAKIADDATGAIVRLDLGYNNTAYRWFTGYVERDQPSGNGFRRLFVREMTGVFEKHWPLSLQPPTLRQVTQALSVASGIEFILPAAGLHRHTDPALCSQRHRLAIAEHARSGFWY
ncbi:hypothetical protein ACOMDM_09235 [Serratia plymuthica]|uniref:hypothetical protein n=1 Tax=Serratia plymuthica TaxID=82996 RepID=UPI003BA14241